MNFAGRGSKKQKSSIIGIFILFPKNTKRVFVLFIYLFSPRPWDHTPRTPLGTQTKPIIRSFLNFSILTTDMASFPPFSYICFGYCHFWYVFPILLLSNSITGPSSMHLQFARINSLQQFQRSNTTQESAVVGSIHLLSRRNQRRLSGVGQGDKFSN